MKPESGGGLLLLRHVTPLQRRDVVYFCSGAYSRDYAYMIRHENHGKLAKDIWNPRYELVMEGAYRFQLSHFAFFQPDIQWDVRPGGIGSIPNAIVAGAEAGVTF